MAEDAHLPSSLDDVTFPHPREDCVDAVRAAQAYVHESDGATRAEILNAIEPEENHRIGIAAAQALGKVNDIPGYRDWIWREVIEPGLRVLPDIEPPAEDTRAWQPITDAERT